METSIADMYKSIMLWATMGTNAGMLIGFACTRGWEEFDENVIWAGFGICVGFLIIGGILNTLFIG